MLYFINPKVRCTHLEALKELIEQVITGRTLITATLSQLRSRAMPPTIKYRLSLLS